MKVVKRNGETQDLDLDKIHKVLQWAVNGDTSNNLKPIKGVSVSAIELQAKLNLYTGIKTSAIHATLIKSAASMISEDTPNYDHVAARLVWFATRKEAFNQNEPPALIEVVKTNIGREVYDPDILDMYSVEEWETINSFIDHTRDDLLRYSGAMQMAKKYVVQNRKTKQVYESFQFPYILVPAVLFSKYPEETRLEYIKSAYDILSTHELSMPTPMMAGLRTRTKQFSSCTLIEAGDSLESINAAASAIVNYASQKAGIGLSMGALRAEGQPVRGGDAVTTGVLPFAKYFASALKSCSQGAVRGASATFNWPMWHLEFETLIELKNSKGSPETRLRNVDYCVHVNKVMYERLIQKKDITFFSPEEVPELYQAFYDKDVDAFRTLYEDCEANLSLTKKSLPAVAVFSKFANERFETSRYYLLNADLVNNQTPILEPIKMTNLCEEVVQHTEPLTNTGGLIALCTLMAVNVGKPNVMQRMPVICDMAIRLLNEVLDYQEYPHPAAERHTRLYRPLGVGMIGFAHYLARNMLRWGEEDCLKQVNELAASFSYHLIKASNELAKEKGQRTQVKTNYDFGIFPHNQSNYCQNLGSGQDLDWEALAESCREHGVMNATVMAFMPSETSSQLANETNGVEPPKDLVTNKTNGDVVAAQVVPEFQRLNHVYQTVWDVTVPNYLKTVAVLQKFNDQSISTNTSYNPQRDNMTTGQIIKDILLAYSLGIKTLYYNNVLRHDNTSIDSQQPQEEEECESGACKI